MPSLSLSQQIDPHSFTPQRVMARSQALQTNSIAAWSWVDRVPIWLEKQVGWGTRRGLGSLSGYLYLMHFEGGFWFFYYLQMISVSVRQLDITDPLFSLFAVFLFAVGLGPCQETCCCFLVRSGGPVVMADLESQPSSFLQFRFLVLQYC